MEFISHFETAVIREARARGATGVVCGHIHTPDIRQIGDIHYLNDGDWVESCTALVEHLDGRFEILEWAKLRTSHQWARNADPDRDRRLVPAS